MKKLIGLILFLCPVFMGTTSEAFEMAHPPSTVTTPLWAGKRPDVLVEEQTEGMAADQETEKLQEVFYIYQDRTSPNNHYIPSGWMGDFSDLAMNMEYRGSPHSGNSCIKVTYSAEGSQGANWAAVIWQTPRNNWGDEEGGYNLSSMKRITFWARGAKGGEKIAEFRVGGLQGPHGDSDSVSGGPVVLSKEWHKYTLDLSERDLSHVIGGFCWAISRADNPQGATFYLDDIRYER